VVAIDIGRGGQMHLAGFEAEQMPGAYVVSSPGVTRIGDCCGNRRGGG
jgi:hypothetical protein